MIVDLLRNDLARSCRAGSVEVVEPVRLETHPTIHHLVATVRGEIAPGLGAVDVVRNAWPGGSISGVPKIRAMEVIDALEATRRGPYTGSIGWFGHDGRADLNVLIRTLRLEGGRAWLHGGGGVTDDFPLAMAYAHLRTLRLADGPDEVHKRAIARRELRQYRELRPGGLR